MNKSPIKIKLISLKILSAIFLFYKKLLIHKIAFLIIAKSRKNQNKCFNVLKIPSKHLTVINLL